MTQSLQQYRRAAQVLHVDPVAIHDVRALGLWELAYGPAFFFFGGQVCPNFGRDPPQLGLRCLCICYSVVTGSTLQYRHWYEMTSNIVPCCCYTQMLHQERNHVRYPPFAGPDATCAALQKEEADGSTAASTPRLEDAVRRQRLRALRARVVALTQVAAGKNPETNEAECSKVSPEALLPK